MLPLKYLDELTVDAKNHEPSPYGGSRCYTEYIKQQHFLQLFNFTMIVHEIQMHERRLKRQRVLETTGGLAV